MRRTARLPGAGIPGCGARRPEQSLPLIWGRKIYTIFIGGGTPSLMSAAGLDRLLSDVRTLLPLEINCRDHDGSQSRHLRGEKFKSYRASGINRLSIGIQSFNGATCRRWAASTTRTKPARRSRSRTPTSTTSTST
jgi:coproporphyrinogen III oxidase-like Fe-S oxidoreductase